MPIKISLAVRFLSSYDTGVKLTAQSETYPVTTLKVQTMIQ